MKRMIFGLFFLLALGSGVQAQSSFYQGKSIKLIVGSPAGSNYDQYGRLLAPYLGESIGVSTRQARPIMSIVWPRLTG